MWDVRLESRAAPMTGAMDAEVLDGPASLRRPAGELWIAIVEAGAAHDGPFIVGAGDVLVWEGDDPMAVELRPIDEVPVQIVVVKLGRHDRSELRWVP